MKTIETYSTGETFALGRQIGQQAEAGEIYTLIGDLGVGKTVLTQESLPGWALKSRSTALLLRSYRSMRRAGCLFTISMCTVSAMWRRWRRSAMKTVFTGKGSA